MLQLISLPHHSFGIITARTEKDIDGYGEVAPVLATSRHRLRVFVTMLVMLDSSLETA